MSEYTGALHNNASIFWYKAIANAITDKSTEAIANFESACEIAKSNTALVNKFLFGDFRFLNDLNKPKVEKTFNQSSCKISM